MENWTSERNGQINREKQIRISTVRLDSEFSSLLTDKKCVAFKLRLLGNHKIKVCIGMYKYTLQEGQFLKCKNIELRENR